MLYKALIAFSLLVLSSISAAAQSTSAAFDVASIKPSDPDLRGVSFRNGPGALNISGATVRLLIQQAYNIRDSQLSGGPGWINTERYDIVAKTELFPGRDGAAPSPADQEKQMEIQRERLRTLLYERFHLKIRRETKEMPVYVLAVSKGGPKLKESVIKDEPAPEGRKGPESPRGAFMRVGRGQIIGQSIGLANLANLLSNQLGRIVIDKTGLTGTYDFTLEWTPDQGPAPGTGFALPGEPGSSKTTAQPNAPVPEEPNGPSVFAAIQEQLGLKLESQRAPVEVVVVESVDRPSEN